MLPAAVKQPCLMALCLTDGFLSIASGKLEAANRGLPALASPAKHLLLQAIHTKVLELTGARRSR